MWIFLSPRTYQRIHNIILPSKNGTSQIDHILISQFGIFIVETKNMRGWIYGSEKDKNWTQNLFGYKHPFQNPLRQTFRQKKVLSEFLDIDESVINTVVFFGGACALKTSMPPNVLSSGLISYIASFNETILSSEEVSTIVNTLKKHKSESRLTLKDHIRSTKQRHNSANLCPKCSGKLVERTAGKGSYAGSQFLGCENYPKCRFTKDMPETHKRRKNRSKCRGIGKDKSRDR